MLILPLQALAERHALVIGNSQYQYSPLKNPRNDARDMAAVLKDLGYRIAGGGAQLDLDAESFDRVFHDFLKTLRNGDIAVFYFAGHGASAKQENYLIPINSRISHSAQLRHRSTPLYEVIESLKVANPDGLNALFVDVCRDQPFGRSFRTSDRGLARLGSVPSGTFISLAASEGQVAADGHGRNGLYTGHLLAQLRENPGLDIEDLHKAVARNVYRSSRNSGDTQRPTYQSDLIEKWCLADCDRAPSHGKARLTVKTEPPDARVRVMNIARSYRDGMEVKLGERYDIFVSASGYTPYRAWHVADEMEAVIPVVLESTAKPKPIRLQDTPTEPQIKEVTPVVLGSTVKSEPTPQRDTSLEPEIEEVKPVALESTAKPASTRLPDTALAPEMIDIPGGSFLMGCLNNDRVCNDNERPARRVQVKPFRLGRTEVTVSQFRAFVDATGYSTEAIGNSGCMTWKDGKRAYSVESLDFGRWEYRDWASDDAGPGYRVGALVDSHLEYSAGSDWRNPGYLTSDDFPVVCVSWNDVQAYIEWLNDETGKRYRLPSEAEWEYAARGGTHTEYWFGSNSADLCAYGNVADQTRSSTDSSWTNKAACSDGYWFAAPVGSFKSTWLGLKDMHGNVWEWLQDRSHGDYKGAPTDGSAWENGWDSRRILRGGSWLNPPVDSRTAYRLRDLPDQRLYNAGFRLAEGVVTSAAVESAVKPQPTPTQNLWFEPQMVDIPGGSFRMGCLSDEGDCYDDEKPAHDVRIKPFRMGKFEVTFAQYDVYADDTGKRKPKDWTWGRGNRPVIDVSWDDIQGHILWLNKKTGKSYRLPSEAEWEFAARAGTETQYSWGDAIGVGRANCRDCGSRWDSQTTAPVGSFSPNPFDLHDMHGNVWEWVQDAAHDSYRGAPADGSAWLRDGDIRRVMRGGSFGDVSQHLRVAYRTRDTPRLRYSRVGFRLAEDVSH